MNRNFSYATITLKSNWHKRAEKRKYPPLGSGLRDLELHIFLGKRGRRAYEKDLKLRHG